MSEPIYHQHRYARELDRLVTPGCSWLDIGAGHSIHGSWLGPKPEELARRPAFFAGCDVVPSILDHPYLHDARIADAAALPWPAASFDVVSANMVVEHLSDPVAVFREVRRVLKPGGAFVFVTPNRMHPIIRTVSLVVSTKLRRKYATMVERRPSEDVFATCYQCNTVSDVVAVARMAGLWIDAIEAFASEYPILRGPLGKIEAWCIHRTGHRWGPRYGADLIGVLRAPIQGLRSSSERSLRQDIVRAATPA